MAKGTVVADLDVTELARIRGIDGIALRRNRQIFSVAGAGVVNRYISEVSFDVAANSTVTIADASFHPGLILFKATIEPTGTGHTVTLTKGQFNAAGNNVATFADIDDALLVYFDRFGNGTVIENVGTVGLA